MEFYIFWGFNAVMALVFIFIMSFTLERGASHKKPWKKIFKTLFKRLGIVVIAYIVLFYIIGAIFMKSYNKECSPNKDDIAIMKPMAQKIADYIVTNGIPKSLEDIPDLPYVVEGCEMNKEYWDYKGNIVIKDIALLYKINEKCKYANNNISINFGVTLWIKDNLWSGMIKLTSINKTTLFYSFESDNKNTFKFDDIHIGSHKDDGICNPMRQ